MKQVLIIIIFIFATAACGGNAGDRFLGDSEKIAPTPTPPSLQNIQVNQTRVLPPFGVKVRADVASLKLHVSLLKVDPVDRLETIQKAVEKISELAAKNDGVNFENVSISRISSNSDRATAVPYLSESYDTSSIVIKLTTDLADHNYNLLESLIVFNDFLSTLNLPETVVLNTLSVEAEISEPEIYREQLVDKVYQELETIQAEYGQAINFEITGLHGGLQTIPLSDTEYYLYLEPAIIVNEF